eukprot:5197476-Ditylum_brightwellii.AAC.1
MDRTSRSLRYYREKAEAWERAYKTRPRIQLEEMGACTVPSGEIQVKKKCRRGLYPQTNGSATMNNLARQARNADNEQGEKKEAAEKKRQDRKAKKEEKDRAQAELIA